MIHYNGYYKVGNQIINNKFYALLEGTARNTNVKWWYYDEIYDKACQSFTSYETPLAEVYKKRAQQLRDKYDYLILNYSGGADSHNILCTFLKNNIRLDHLYIQWPLSLMNKGLYKPNLHDTTNYNFHSEWDFVIKQDLEWISRQHPNIKIEIDDWVYGIDEKFYDDDLMINNVTNLPSIARAQKQNRFSTTESKLSNLGLKVGSIYGVDKPIFATKNNKAYFRMPDTGCMAQPNPENPHGMEYFYFTPDMPEIPILQTYKLFYHYQSGNKNNFIRKLLIDDEWYKPQHEYSETFKYVCYPYWKFDRFQADKPHAYSVGMPAGARAWDNILIKSMTNFKRVQQKWEYNWLSYQKLIDKVYLLNGDDGVRAITTKWHEIRI